jgi:hypothetical protein
VALVSPDHACALRAKASIHLRLNPWNSAAEFRRNISTKEGETMRVFISWSGIRSEAIAVALKDWLQDVFPQLDVWMSAHDIEAGARWNTELNEILETCNFGILCLTPENQREPWLLFEAGALAKTSKVARVIPYRIALSASNIQYPLAQFQGVDSDEHGTFKLIQTINETGGWLMPSEKLERHFHKWWPDLETQLERIPDIEHEIMPKRPDRELLEEILELLRNSSRQSSVSASILNRTLAQENFDNHRERVIVTIDARPIFGKEALIPMVFFEDTTVSAFLTTIYFKLNKFGDIPAYTYGDVWILEDASSGTKYDNIGIEFCRSKGSKTDNRTLSTVGIISGMTLQTVFLKKPTTITKDDSEQNTLSDA